MKKLETDAGRILYYSLVLQHPVVGEQPIDVAELITTDHDVDEEYPSFWQNSYATLI